MPDTRLGARISVRHSLTYALTYRLRLAGSPEPIGEGRRNRASLAREGRAFLRSGVDLATNRARRW
jgi:hypothetical protein